MTRYQPAVSAAEMDDLMGLMWEKPEPHLAEDENMGDEAYVFVTEDPEYTS